jgi:hypothetical protein
MNQRVFDLYSREEFARQLIDDLKSFETPFSVGLDAKWGDGKTFFVDNFLKTTCESQQIPMVVYDCFEHERETDPFVSLTKEILELAGSYKTANQSESKTIESKLTEAGKKATSLFVGLAKTAAVAGAKIFLKQELEQLVENFDETPDSAGVEQDLVTFIEEQLKPGNQIKNLKNSFHESITKLIDEISPQNKFIIVVIDELDRCRPNHAVDVLESIKHLLSISGIYFLFTYHKAQLKSSLRHIYGSDLDANLYLQKFMDLDIEIPGGGLSDQNDKYKRLFEQYLVKAKLTDSARKYTLQKSQHYAALSGVYKFSPRDVQRCILLHVAYERKGIELLNDFTVTLLIILKVKFGDVVGEISKGTYPLPEDILRKYCLADVLKMLEKKAPSIKEQLIEDLGFLMSGSITTGSVINQAPTQGEIKHTIKNVKKVLGGDV